jgi:hypothetical protein
MSSARPSQITLPVPGLPGPQDSALDTDTPRSLPPALSPGLAAAGSPRGFRVQQPRVSFSTVRSRRGSRWRALADDEALSGGGGDALPPPIPSALAPPGDAATPLPLLSMLVLSIVRAVDCGRRAGG